MALFLSEWLSFSGSIIEYKFSFPKAKNSRCKNIPSFTHPALRAMFLGKKEIDDLAYRISECTKENSPVIRMLEEQGYHLKIMSEYFYDYFPVQYRCRHFYTDIAAPFSMKLWDMLAEMLLGEQKDMNSSLYWRTGSMVWHINPKRIMMYKRFIKCQLRINNKK